MNKSAMLFAYPELRFIRMILRLRNYLESAGCKTDVHVLTNPWATLEQLQRWVTEAETAEVSLLVYSGHGSKSGWGHKFFPPLPYSHITPKLARLAKLLVINDTCFGLNVLPTLAKQRSPLNTGFITAWDGATINFGGPTSDAQRFWPQGKRVEDVFPTLIHSSDKGDKEVVAQYRWGREMDEHFFPPH